MTEKTSGSAPNSNIAILPKDHEPILPYGWAPETAIPRGKDSISAKQVLREALRAAFFEAGSGTELAIDEERALAAFLREVTRP